MSTSAATVTETTGGARRTGALLFAAMFASQAALIAITPSLEQAAADLGVSTATAGHLRTLSGLSAGVVALLAARATATFGLRGLLAGGSMVLAAASALSAVAPSFAVLAVAQALVGIGVAAVVGSAGAAAADWVSPGERDRALSWALNGQAGAWIVGMPVLALVGGASWRYAWLALPLVAALAAAAALARYGARPSAAPAAPSRLAETLRERRVAHWAASELLANAAWVGLLVFTGALFTESYGISVEATGLLLSGVATAYVAGNLAGRRWIRGDASRTAAALAVGLAVTTALVGAVRPAPAVTASILAVCAFLAGGRSLAGAAFALRVPPERRASVNGLRVMTNQFGYLVGAGLGAVALATGGYVALGLLFGALFAAAATVASPRVLCHAPGIRGLRGCTATDGA
jgi:predicted MFS family arabinose efflux permease